MKKITIQKYIVFILFTFFFIGTVNAASSIKKEVGMSVGGTTTIFNTGQYEGLVCDGGFDFTEGHQEKDMKYVTLKWRTGGEIIATWKKGANFVKGAQETLNCTYTQPPTNEGVGNGSGTLTIVIKYIELNSNTEYNFTLDQYTNKSNRVAGPSGVFSNVREITKVEISNNKGEYIKTDCEKTYCDVSVNQNAKISKNGVTVKMQLDYIGTDDKNYHITSNIDVTSTLAVLAYPGDYGKCSFDNSWQDYNNAKRKYLYDGVNSVTFPSCSSSNAAEPFNSLLEFKGWVTQGNGQQPGKDVQTTDSCTKYSPKMSTNINPADNQYFSCFAVSKAVILSDIGRVKVDDNSWISGSGGAFLYKKGNSITLPNATPIKTKESELTGDTVFLGWTEEPGNCSTSVMKKAGETVSGGQYYPCVERSWAEYDKNKTITVGQTEKLTVSGFTATSCASASTEHIIADYKGEACVIKGKKVTGDKSYNVTLSDKKGNKIVFKVKVVADGNVTEVSDDYYILDSTDGSQVINSKYKETITIDGETCSYYKVESDEETKKEAGRDIGSYNGTKLLVHRYFGATKCKSKSGRTTTRNFVGICMDPGKQEPDYTTINGNTIDDDIGEYNYVNMGNTSTADGTTNEGKFNKIITYIYRQDDFLESLDKAAKKNCSGANACIPDAFAAATPAIRLAAIKYGYDSNNTGLGLNQYYEAYKDIKKNIDNYLGTHFASDNHPKSWKHIAEVSKPKRKKMFCGNVSDCNLDMNIWNIVAEYLGNGANSESMDLSEEKLKVTQTDIKTTWHDQNSYTKVVKGEISGANYEKAKLNFAPSCPNTVSCTLEIKGKNGQYVNVTAQDAPSNWHKQRDNGKLYYKLTIKGNLSNQQLRESKDFKAVIKADVASPDSSENTKKATPASNNNKQNMVLYNTKLRATGNGDGSGGNYSIQLEDGGPWLPLAMIPEEFEITTILPSCDVKKDVFNYKQCESQSNCSSSFSGNLFSAAGCCSYITDQEKYSHVYNAYCTNDCTSTVTMPICKFNNSSSTSDKVSIREAYKPSTNTENYACVLGETISKTKANENYYADMAGNTYLISLYENNPYCRVSCKEDWDFTFPGFKHFTGVNAVKAGGSFDVLDKEIYIKGSRTCVTTKIDTTQYLKDLTDLSAKSQQNHIDFQKKKILNKAYGSSEKKEETKYYCSNIQPQWQSARCLTDQSLTQENCPAGQWASGRYIYVCTEVKSCNHITLESKDENGDKYSDLNNNKLDLATPTLETKYEEGSCHCSGNSASTCSCDGTTQGSCDENPSIQKVYSEKFGYDYNTRTQDGSKEEQAENAAAAAINQKRSQYEACTKFELITDQMKSQAGYTSFKTTFTPSISYTYEESEYMNQIGSNNKLARNETLNAYCKSHPDDCPNQVFDLQRKSYFYNESDGFVFETYSSRNPKVMEVGNSGENLDSITKNQSIKVCTPGGSGFYISGVSKESSGTLQSYDSKPQCFDTQIYYVNADYIKRSISDSSYYGNEYKWFFNTLTDEKVHVKVSNEAIEGNKNAEIKSAITSVYSGTYKANEWSLLSNRQLDSSVFPIKMTTPRNMYQYVYKITGVGMYNNGEGSSGRLIGNSNSVIKNNERICFYEVYENICLCCGDVIDTEVVAPGNSDNQMSTEEAFEVATKGTSKNYNFSDLSRAEINEDGQLGFFNTSISLNDLNSDSNRMLGSNWSNMSKYTTNGSVYTTSKGAELKNYIEGKGENIYDETPEYSYTLTPQAMAAIRDYNKANGYQVQSNELKTYGEVKIYKSDDDNKWEAGIGSVRFTHYGSKFLEETINQYETRQYEGTLLSDRRDNNVCFVTAKQYKNNEFAGLSKNKCRWIDYVQSVGNGSTRLSFK